jgi:hypothetical protein
LRAADADAEYAGFLADLGFETDDFLETDFLETELLAVVFLAVF